MLTQGNYEYILSRSAAIFAGNSMLREHCSSDDFAHEFVDKALQLDWGDRAEKADCCVRTFISRKLNWLALDKMRTLERHNTILAAERQYVCAPLSSTQDEIHLELELYDTLESLLTPELCLIAKMRMHGSTLRDIGKAIGVSDPTVLDRLKLIGGLLKDVYLP